MKRWLDRGLGARIVFTGDGEVTVPVGKSLPVVEDDIPEVPLPVLDLSEDDFIDFCADCITDPVPSGAGYFFVARKDKISAMAAQLDEVNYLIELYSKPLLKEAETVISAKESSIDTTPEGYPVGVWFDGDWFPYVFKPGEIQRLLYCVVLEPEVVDLEGDKHPAPVIQAGAHDFCANLNKAKSRPPELPGTETGIQHLIIGIDVDVVESYIAPCDLALPEWNGKAVTKGTWIIVLRVRSDELWADVESGKFTGVSYGGLSRIVPLNGFKLPKVPKK